jgi:ATP-dependent RNA helicase DDX10/DBP4
VLFLSPSEEKFIERLQTARVTIQNIRPKQDKMTSITGSLSALLAGQQEIKHLAQKAFTSYMRSMQLMKDKEVFDVSKLPSEAFANSLGLVEAPSLAGAENMDHESNPLRKKKNMTPLERLREKIRQKKLAKKATANAAAAHEDEAEVGAAPGSNDEDDPDLEQDKAKKPGKWERRQRRIARAKGAAKVAVSNADAGDGDEALLQPVETERQVEEAPKTKKKVLKLRRNGTAVGNAGTHTYFSEEGGKHASELGLVAEDLGGVEAKDLVGLEVTATDTVVGRKGFLKQVAQNLELRRSEDVAADRERVKERRKRQKGLAEEDDDGIDTGVTLGGASSASSRSPSPEASPSPAPKRKLKKRPKTTQETSESAGAATTALTARAEVAETMATGDELGALEREALRRLGGGALFA